MIKQNIYKLLSLLVGFIVTTIVAFIIQYLMKLCEKNGFTNEHEDIIKQFLVKNEDLEVSLEDVGGLESVKKEMFNSVLLPLKYPKAFSENKLLTPNRGVLFYGPPGTGKTMLAKALAKEANVPLLSISACALESKWFGESSKLISSTFSVARKLQPCIVFFDEIDGMGRSRTDFDQSFVNTFKTELLSNLDGMGNKSTDSYVVIACTNTFNSLDPALLRRFPSQYNIKLPSQKERRDILTLLTKNESISIADIVQISNWTDGYSGSDLKALYNKASHNRLQESFEDGEFIKSLEENSDISRKIKKIKLHHWKTSLGIQEHDNIDESAQRAHEVVTDSVKEDVP